MKICIIGSYTGYLDEGMANISYQISNNIPKDNYEVKQFNIEKIVNLKFLKKIIKFKPDIIHFFPGPTIKGLLFLKFIQKISKAKTIVSATKPDISNTLIAKMLKPNKVIIQSKKSEKLFKKMGFETVFISNGVDTSKFVPITNEEKNNLRKKYGFLKDDFIILHVGPIKKSRNQGILKQIPNSKILLITSTTNPSDQKLLDDYKKSGIVVWTDYFQNIEKIYAMVDVYVFPVFEELGSVDIPLSILEAMACNIPVITTRFGGIELLFDEQDDFFYIDNEKDLKEKIQLVQKGELKKNTEKLIQRYSWNNIVKEILNVYEDVLV